MIDKKPKLLNCVRNVLRVKHYSFKTEVSYIKWIIRFIKFHGKKHPVNLGTAHVNQFLTALAVQGNVSASTQNQALNVIAFLQQALDL